MAKMYSEDAYSLGLLYVYIYSNKVQKMVPLKNLEKFHECIEKNIKEISESSNNVSGFEYEEEPIYFCSKDEKGQTYYILKPDLDLERAKNIFIRSASVNQIVASQMTNALDSLGLVKLDGEIKAKISIMRFKHDGESCNECDYSLSEELLNSIIEENPKYKELSERELKKIIGFCELEIEEETVKNMGYWCPKFLSKQI